MELNQLSVADNYGDLPEKGEAVRVDSKGKVIAWFLDGNLDSPIDSKKDLSQDITKISAS
jgi:hypothetical protein